MQTRIGASTGWLYDADIFDLSAQEEILKQGGLNTIEIYSAWKIKTMSALLNQTFTYFDNNSLHLPNFDAGRSFENNVSFAKKIIDKHDIKIAVLHPVDVPENYYEELISENLTLAIENMDQRQTQGKVIAELEALLDKFDDLRFVLDLQHAYESDSSMGYAEYLYEMTKDKLSHIHISGESGEKNHVLVHQADNKDAILGLAGKICSEKNVPIIIEGQYEDAKALKKELEFLKKELNLG